MYMHSFQNKLVHFEDRQSTYTHLFQNKQVHFMRSVRRVAQKVNRTSKLGVQAFTVIGYKLLEVKDTEKVSTLLDVLGGKRPLSEALLLMPKSRALMEYSSKHNPKTWEECCHWV